MSKSLYEVQREVDKWIEENGGYWDILGRILSIIEELGELARMLNYFYGAKKIKKLYKKEGIEEEIGDLFFNIVCLANTNNVDLEKNFNNTILKYNSRS